MRGILFGGVEWGRGVISRKCEKGTFAEDHGSCEVLD